MDAREWPADAIELPWPITTRIYLKDGRKQACSCGRVDFLIWIAPPKGADDEVKSDVTRWKSWVTCPRCLPPTDGAIVLGEIDGSGLILERVGVFPERDDHE